MLIHGIISCQLFKKFKKRVTAGPEKCDPVCIYIISEQSNSELRQDGWLEGKFDAFKLPESKP